METDEQKKPRSWRKMFNIRGLDLEVHRQVKASIALSGRSLGEWYTEAAREKLEREKE